MKLWLHGASGKMGREIQTALARPVELCGMTKSGERDAKVLGGAIAACDPDIIVDFSNADGNLLLLEALSGSAIRNVAVLIGATGIEDFQLTTWKECATKNDWRLMVAPNTSIGVATTLHAAAVVAGTLVPKGFDMAIVETHHKAKIDAPSGTAKWIARALQSVVPGLKTSLHSIRGGGVFGEHEIRFLGPHEEVVIKHRAFSRGLFAQGALHLASWLIQQKPGAYTPMDALMRA